MHSIFSGERTLIHQANRSTIFDFDHLVKRRIIITASHRASNSIFDSDEIIFSISLFKLDKKKGTDMRHWYAYQVNPVCFDISQLEIRLIYHNSHEYQMLRVSRISYLVPCEQCPPYFAYRYTIPKNKDIPVSSFISIEETSGERTIDHDSDNYEKVSTNFSLHSAYTLNPSLHTWDEVIQHYDLAGLNKFIQSLTPEVLACQDTSGNTPLHCVIEAQDPEIVGSILRFVPNTKCLEIRNDDGLTPLDLAFEKKLWVQARLLVEHHIKTGADGIFLQQYFYKAMREQGGVDFLPHLLDLREDHFPGLDLNFTAGAGGRTPWWYLANSNDVNVMCRILQTLKNHSIDLMQLLTHTERETKLVEEAAEKNRVLFTTIQKVAGWHHSSETDYQDMADGNETCSHKALSRATSCSSISTPSCSNEPENQVSIQHKPCVAYNPPISDSSSEEWKQVDSISKPKKQKNKKLV